jgi:ABC-type uncharacterized transport system permease subunit
MMSIYSWLFSVPAILAYLAAAGAMVFALRRDYLTTEGRKRSRIPAQSIGWLAVALHGLSTAVDVGNAGVINLGFLSASSLTMLSIAAILLLVSLAKPVESLGIIVFPLCALALLLKLSFPVEAHVPKDHSWPMKLHIVVSMLAYSFLNIAAIQAVLLALQEWRLRTHQMSRLSRSLPPLQTMESLLFQLIGAGFVLLSVSLLTGFLFLENLFAQHLAHKTILSLTAWVVFGVLLWGRTVHGWRGKTAIRWTLGGFAALMLGYFGSKVVLELILHRV